MSRRVHMFGRINKEGRVSPYCAKALRGMDLRVSTWTFSPEAVTCPRCKGAQSPWERVPPSDSTAINTLREEIDAREWSVEDVASRCALGPRHIEAVLLGTNPFTPYVCENLAKALGVSAEFWLKLSDFHRNSPYRTNGYPAIGSKWRHSKTGTIYEVLLIVWLERTHQPHVCYLAVGTLGAWARPVSEWEELVAVNGEMVPRFVPATEASE